MCLTIVNDHPVVDRQSPRNLGDPPGSPPARGCPHPLPKCPWIVSAPNCDLGLECCRHRVGVIRARITPTTGSAGPTGAHWTALRHMKLAVKHSGGNRGPRADTRLILPPVRAVQGVPGVATAGAAPPASTLGPAISASRLVVGVTSAGTFWAELMGRPAPVDRCTAILR
jgi:hypothetical protein